MRNLANPSTLPYTPVSPSQSSTDHIPFPYSIQRPESVPLSCPAPRVDYPSSSTRSEEMFISVSDLFLRNNHTSSSRVPGVMTNRNHSPDSEQTRRLVPTREHVITPHSEGGHRVPVTFDPYGEIPDQGSLSEPEYLSGTGYMLRRVRHGPRVQGHTRQGWLTTEGRRLSPPMLFPSHLNSHFSSRSKSRPTPDTLEFQIVNISLPLRFGCISGTQSF